MNNNISAGFSDKPARIISVIFHPLLIPLYGLVIIFSAPTLYYYVPFEVKKLVFLIVLVNNVLLPMSLIPLLIHSNLIKSWSLRERRDRVLPLIISTVLYLVTTYILFRFTLPRFLKYYTVGASFTSLAALAINFRWRISLHSTGAGFLIALVLILSFKMYTPLMWYIVPSFIGAGLVLSSRLQLNLHSPAEVWGGFLTGIAGFSLPVMVLQQFL